MTDEVLRRRGTFQEGLSIPMADHQAWVFPIAGGELRLTAAKHDEYLGILKAYAEGEDATERQLAELALAIFLIELNYELDSRELALLFSFPPGSPALLEAHASFRNLALGHLEAVQGGASLDADSQELPIAPGPKLWGRSVAWLKAPVAGRRVSFNIPEGESPL